MAEFEKITDLKQLESWLTTQDPRMSRAIAARAALRALPALMALGVQTAGKTPDASLLLSRLRATLISGVASSCPIDMMRTQNSAHAAVAPYAEDSPASATVAFASSANFSASDAASTVYTSARTALSYSTLSARYDARSAAFSAAFSDAERGKDGEASQVFAALLWPNSNDIAQLLQIWETFEARPDPDGIWSFWRDWYRSMLQGTPMDWDLQLQVALIDNAIWEAGPETVAKEISRIRAKFELEQEVKHLKEQLTALRQATTSPQIGDNGGPPLDALPSKAFKNDIVLLWDDLDTLEAEIAKPAPSRAILKRIGRSLSEIALRITSHCGATLDVAVKAGAKTIGTAVGGLVVADYIKPGAIEAVAKAIGTFLATL
ncbi:hypothetical protein [Pseudophaeobacter leonis]|uniref:hypothetical protein n=1 Tax=Pseudophaeobacter leonis TaxID=1144477 RepID=UPI00111C6682|nr:hypothetical protein [Pseudophaeobacter leonis]